MRGSLRSLRLGEAARGPVVSDHAGRKGWATNERLLLIMIKLLRGAAAAVYISLGVVLDHCVTLCGE